MAQRYKRPVLCWSCKKACGGCSWSDRGIPVDGAVMAESTRKETKGILQRVEACPEYQRDNGDFGQVNDDGVRALCGAIVASAGRDYLAACEMFARKKDATDADKPSAMIQGELFFRSEYGRMVTEGDPVVIMNAIRKRAGLEPIKD